MDPLTTRASRHAELSEQLDGRFQIALQLFFLWTYTGQRRRPFDGLKPPVNKLLPTR